MGTNVARIVGIFGSLDSNQNMLVERILACSNVTNASSSRIVTSSSWGGHKILFIENIEGKYELERAMRALDGIVLAVDGARGLQAENREAWRWAHKLGLPMLVVVNQVNDLTFPHLDSPLESAGGTTVSVCPPVSGAVLDVVNGVRLTFHGGNGEDTQSHALTSEWSGDFDLMREHLVTTLMDHDDEIAEAYLLDAVEPGQLWAVLRTTTCSAAVYPIVAGTITEGWGVQPMLDAIVKLFPSPNERPSFKARAEGSGDQEEVGPDPDGSLVAFAFKVQVENGQRRLLVRLLRGRIAPGQVIRISESEEGEQVAEVLDGETGTPLESAEAGTFVWLTGLQRATAGNTLCDPARVVTVELHGHQNPLVTATIIPNSPDALSPLTTALQHRCEVDPGLELDIDSGTGQLTLRGLTEDHIVRSLTGFGARLGATKVITQQTSEGVLEPLMRVALSITEEHVGEVVSEIHRRGGEVENVTTNESSGRKEVASVCRLRTLFGFGDAVRTFTQGNCTVTIEFDRYVEAGS